MKMLMVPADGHKPVREVRVPWSDGATSRKIRRLIGYDDVRRHTLSVPRYDHGAEIRVFAADLAADQLCSLQRNRRAEQLVSVAVHGDVVVVGILSLGGRFFAGLSPEAGRRLLGRMGAGW